MIKNLIITCAMFIAVNYSAQTAKAAMPDGFYNCWMASYEEDDQTTNIRNFRTCDSKEFKPTRYRQSVTYEKNGKCKYLQLAANDAHYFVNGKWVYNKKSKVVTVKDDKDKIVFAFKILHIEKTMMKVEFEATK